MRSAAVGGVDLGDLRLRGAEQISERSHDRKPTQLVGIWLRGSDAQAAGHRSGPISTASANRSMAVDSPLTITTRAPAALARGTTLAAGNTDNVEPTASNRSHSSAAMHRRVDHLGNQRLPERDGVALQDADPAVRRAHEAVRIVLTRSHSFQRLLHRAAVVARPATTPAHRAVHLDDLPGRMSGLLMQLVDVLRHDRAQPALSLEFVDRQVSAVGHGRPTPANAAGSATRTGEPPGRRDSSAMSMPSRRPGSSSTRRSARGSRECPSRSRCPAPVSTVIAWAASIHCRARSKSSSIIATS